MVFVPVEILFSGGLREKVNIPEEYAVRGKQVSVVDQSGKVWTGHIIDILELQESSVCITYEDIIPF